VNGYVGAMQSLFETHWPVPPSGACTHVWLTHASPLAHAFSDCFRPTEAQSSDERQHNAGLGLVQAAVARKSANATTTTCRIRML
jgi:hypothetical protein